MTENHPNFAVLQAFNHADVRSSSSLIADDAVFHYFNPELPDLNGDYNGKEGFIEFFEKLGGLTQGTFQVNPQSIHAFGDELVITHVRNTMSLTDKQIEIDAVVVWRIVNAQIKEAWDIPALYTANIVETKPRDH